MFFNILNVSYTCFVSQIIVVVLYFKLEFPDNYINVNNSYFHLYFV